MMTMNATRNVLLRQQQQQQQRMLSQCRRSLHVVSSTIDSSGRKTSQGPHKQSQNNFVAVATMEEQIIPSQQPTAKDIQLLLRNIGANHRASLPTIESMIQKKSSNNSGDNMNADANTGSSSVTAHEVIDLIAQIRSI
mmetsp:Transcript_14024/g.29974  ORF Transcript_14024/g.29974 Transcript_14024/m.29974 type:complete len:138 (+) Transcript_14024:158-571(+)